MSPLSRRGFLTASAALGGTALTSALTGCSSSPSVPPGTKTINHWDWYVSQEPWLKQEIALFQKAHPKIRINRTVQVSDKYPDLINLAFRGNTAPDMLMIPKSPALEQQVADGWLRTLDDYATPQWQAKFPAGNFYNGVDMVEGKTYSAPFGGNSPWLQLYIHNGLFKQAGITNPDGTVKLPKTWDDVTAAAEAITRKTGGKAYGFGFGNVPNVSLPWWVELFVRGAGSPAGYGVDLPDYRVGKWTFGSDRNYADFIELLLEWKKKGYIYPSSMSIGDEQARAFFERGKFGMIVGGVWNQSTWTEHGFKDYSLTTLPSPTANPKAFFYYLPGGRVWALSKSTKVSAESWAWFDWLHSPAAGQRWVEAGQGLSIFPEANKNAKVASEQFQAYIDMRRYALPMPVPAIRNPDASKVVIPAVTPDLPDVLVGLYTGQLGDMGSALTALEDRRNKALADGIKQAQAKGAKVSLADWVFKDWDPTKPYQNKPA
ncbi:ABC transporter substrate-binding protein [Streptomyces sp. 150FB]|uniref:ABC transporter substrate-binding protein n=1 Tax=Streptomyces sp. 150FB TaxID=1576605 RepID=UPI0005890A9F|nr:extracellular solute-binding protein [Streptomyces sp. 150FB]KIF78225.1 ABC transporter substrate-binding protein [Streptomyces sp. 150FB]